MRVVRATSAALLLSAALAVRTLPPGPNDPPAPFDRPGGLTVLWGGSILTPGCDPATRDRSCAAREDLVLAGDKVFARLQPAGTKALLASLEGSGVVVKTVDVSGCALSPGLIDVHVHALGAGGEAGPYSRTPEAKIEELVGAGITTIIGLRGTDSVSRGLPDLLQKMNALGRDITTFMWTGGYHYPVQTLTGSVQTDMVLVDKVIGVGELALSDHRSSWPSLQDVLQVVSDARVGGMLSGKAGVVHFHMGGGPSLIERLWEVVNETTIPFDNLYPTHMSSRGDSLLEQAAKWISAGGMVDFTADAARENSTVPALEAFRARGLPLDRISVSSDAYGSLPDYNAQGQLIAYGVGNPNVTLGTVQRLVREEGWPLAQALQFSTANPARFLQLSQKGSLAVGADADVLVLNESTLAPMYVFAKGQVMKTPSWVKKGMFND